MLENSCLVQGFTYLVPPPSHVKVFVTFWGNFIEPLLPSRMKIEG